MATKLDAMFKKIESNSKQMAIQAMKDVADKAYAMSKKKAAECLKNYYNNHKPKRYKRTNQLKNAIKGMSPYETTKGSIHSIKFGIVYDSKHLDGLYRSNSWYHQSGTEWVGRDDPYFDFDSRNNGIIESSFILGNYLEGIHPWAKIDQESTDEAMTRFFKEELPGTIGDMIYDEMQNAVLNFLKSNGGGK